MDHYGLDQTKRHRILVLGSPGVGKSEYIKGAFAPEQIKTLTVENLTEKLMPHFAGAKEHDHHFTSSFLKNVYFRLYPAQAEIKETGAVDPFRFNREASWKEGILHIVEIATSIPGKSVEQLINRETAKGNKISDGRIKGATTDAENAQKNRPDRIQWRKENPEGFYHLFVDREKIAAINNGKEEIVEGKEELYKKLTSNLA